VLADEIQHLLLSGSELFHHGTLCSFIQVL